MANSQENAACTFCSIVSKQKPAICLYEDSQVLVIKNRFPKVPQHYLVIPKLHIKDLRDNRTREKQEAILHIFANIELYALRCNMPEFTVCVNNGSSVGQTEFHLHVHLMGGSQSKII